MFAEGRDARWHTHVELLGQVGLEVSLPNVDLREIEVTGGGDNEHQADGRGLDNCGKYAIVVDAVLLRIAISNKAGLELLDGRVTEAFDIEDVVAIHEVTTAGHLREGNQVPCAESDEAGELLVDGSFPIVSPRARSRGFVATRDRDVA